MRGDLVADLAARLRAAGCVFAEDEAKLLTEAAGDPAVSAFDPAALAVMVARREAGEPLEYVLGWAGFCGLRIAVDPGVFVPRRRTAFLVRLAARRAHGGAVVVDLCCGSGAVAAAVAALAPGVRLHAVDIDPAAVRCARRNLPGVDVHQGDLYQPLPRDLRGSVDVLVANAPYVPSTAIDLMPPEARLYEPKVALDGGSDGLDVLRRVIAGATDWLAPGGCLLVEASDRQAAPLVTAMAAAGLDPATATADDATVVAGVLSPPEAG